MCCWWSCQRSDGSPLWVLDAGAVLGGWHLPCALSEQNPHACWLRPFEGARWRVSGGLLMPTFGDALVIVMIAALFWLAVTGWGDS